MTESGIVAARRWRTLIAEDSPLGGTAAKLQIVFICTGNRFRSPLAAALFEKEASDGQVAIESAGTLDLGPVPALPEAIEHGRRLGVDLTGHRAQWIDDADLRSVDLVVGFELIHVTTAVVGVGAPRDRAFTLPELVALLELSPSRAAATAAIEGADATRRSMNRTDFPEIPDPLRQGRDVQRETADTIDGLVRRLVPLLSLG